MIIPFKHLLKDAELNGYALGYFESWDIYSLEAVAEAAEELRSPVVIGFGEAVVEYDWYDSGGIEKLASIGLVAANMAKVPLAFIFNEISSFEHAIRGIKSGFNVVMLDSAHLPFSEHIGLTKQLVKVAHSVGVGVEAELGVMPSARQDGSVEEGSYTDPVEAGRFVEETGVDALAVSIGNVHVMKDSSAKIDIDLLKEIHRNVDVPLVVHGGTGLPDEIIPELIKNGVAKINVGTVLKRIYYSTISKGVGSIEENFNIHDIIGSRKKTDIMEKAKLRIKEEVKRRIKVYNPALE